MAHDLLETTDEVLLERMHSTAARALTSGITTVRDLGDRGFLAGRLRDRYRAGAAFGPDVLCSGPPITPTRGHCWFLGGETDDDAAIRAAVAERADRGVDVVKIMATGGLFTPGFGLHESQYGVTKLQAAVEAAHTHGLPITAHAHGPQGIADAVTAGVDGVEHGTFVTVDGVAPDENTIDRLAAHGTFVGATEAWRPDGPPLPPAAASRLEHCWHNFVGMQRAGVPVVCCSDNGVGPRKPHDVLPHGLILFSHSGFTNSEALISATSLAARACGVADRKGRLLPGGGPDHHHERPPGRARRLPQRTARNPLVDADPVGPTLYEPARLPDGAVADHAHDAPRPRRPRGPPCTAAPSRSAP